MLKIKFIEKLVNTTIKNIYKGENKYFLVCNDTHNLYEPFYIYPKIKNGEIIYTIENDDGFYEYKTIEKVFKFFDCYGLINDDTISFYNVSELEI